MCGGLALLREDVVDLSTIGKSMMFKKKLLGVKLRGYFSVDYNIVNSML